MISTDVSILLQKAFFAILSTDAGVIALLGNPVAIYDKVPSAVAVAYQNGNGQTYLTIGAGAEKPELADDFQLDEHIAHFDVWSQTIGMAEAKTVLGAVSAAIVAAYGAGQLALDGFVISTCDPHGRLFERGPDMVTTHGALQMRLLISPAD